MSLYCANCGAPKEGAAHDPDFTLIVELQPGDEIWGRIINDEHAVVAGKVLYVTPDGYRALRSGQPIFLERPTCPSP